MIGEDDDLAISLYGSRRLAAYRLRRDADELMGQIVRDASGKDITVTQQILLRRAANEIDNGVSQSESDTDTH